jgi:hypothetical protein
MASAMATTTTCMARGSGSSGRGGNPCQARNAATSSPSVSFCGCASSHVTFAGAPGLRLSTTVSARSSTLTICTLLLAPATGVGSGQPASPRSIALPPWAAGASTSAGRKIIQSRSSCARCASACAFDRVNGVAPVAAAPTADTCTTRRMPARAQASNSATVPSIWMRATSSRRLSCSTPTQFTTASTPLSSGSHMAASVRRAKSVSIHCA